jgi:RNA polymerase sigma-70 factor (ECF subfamily)
MLAPDLIASVQKYDKAAQKAIFETYYSRLAAIAERYSKNASQAQEIILAGFVSAFKKLIAVKEINDLDLGMFMEREFVLEAVRFIKSFRSEYYVSSTVYATQPSLNNFDLFEEASTTDYNTVPEEVLVKAIQQLVPSQRLVFNLCVIDNFPLEETAALLETSEPTIKSNLEKARYHLQRNIDKISKSTKS